MLTSTARQAVIDCSDRAGVSAYSAPGGLIEVRMVPCGEPVIALEERSGYVYAVLADGQKGYVIRRFVKYSSISEGRGTQSVQTMDSASQPEKSTVAVSPLTGQNLPRPSAQSRPGRVDCSSLKYVELRDSKAGTVTAKLNCNENVTVLAYDDGWKQIQTKEGLVGYVSEWFISEKSRLVTVGPPVFQSPPYGSLSLHVLQSDQIPYSVQVGGGQVSTNCSITGIVDTHGTTTTAGQFSHWVSTSYPDLRMSCASRSTPPAEWRHVANVMLVSASDGNAYIIGCDAAWLWSKCRPLLPGNSFDARWANGGIAVQYQTGRGKSSEATYRVISSRSMR